MVITYQLHYLMQKGRPLRNALFYQQRRLNLRLQPPPYYIQ
jgi:hypothetical protein